MSAVASTPSTPGSASAARSRSSRSVRLFIAAMDTDGGVSDVQQAPVPISVPKAEVATAQGKQFVYSVTLLMRGGSQRVAIGVRDDFGAQASFLSRGVTVGR